MLHKLHKHHDDQSGRCVDCFSQGMSNGQDYVESRLRVIICMRRVLSTGTIRELIEAFDSDPDYWKRELAPELMLLALERMT